LKWKKIKTHWTLRKRNSSWVPRNHIWWRLQNKLEMRNLHQQLYLYIKTTWTSRFLKNLCFKMKLKGRPPANNNMTQIKKKKFLKIKKVNWNSWASKSTELLPKIRFSIYKLKSKLLKNLKLKILIFLKLKRNLSSNKPKYWYKSLHK
jgi:hypothetical protein